MKIEEAQKIVDNWIHEVGIRYFSELTNLAILMEEVGELSRLMARKYGDQSTKKNEDVDKIPNEIGDILFVLICLSNQMGVNLTRELTNTIEKNTNRDQDRHKNNPKLG